MRARTYRNLFTPITSSRQREDFFFSWIQEGVGELFTAETVGAYTVEAVGVRAVY